MISQSIPGFWPAASQPFADALEIMSSMFLSILLLLTILFAFAIGIAFGRWAIFGILHFFDPVRVQQKTAAANALAPAIAAE